ncbi:hypothetical protein BB560_003558 [Smittium megazygosporum]|uniref:Uncharacterized protein n=1 Tax=Smittium megazygosporum TaxID=133381 RepID=A0A2T9ZBQ6_9FUNG|nr:hypothetical protein BB560_003558 [Smittium megazygosporum]
MGDSEYSETESAEHIKTGLLKSLEKLRNAFEALYEKYGHEISDDEVVDVFSGNIVEVSGFETETSDFEVQSGFESAEDNKREDEQFKDDSDSSVKSGYEGAINNPKSKNFGMEQEDDSDSSVKSGYEEQNPMAQKENYFEYGYENGLGKVFINLHRDKYGTGNLGIGEKNSILNAMEQMYRNLGMALGKVYSGESRVVQSYNSVDFEQNNPSNVKNYYHELDGNPGNVGNVGKREEENKMIKYGSNDMVNVEKVVENKHKPKPKYKSSNSRKFKLE